MTAIDDMLNGILQREGGYVDNPNDPGGATNFGITLATLSQWLGRAATIADVQSMTADTAKAIYTQNYLHKPGIDQLPDVVQPVLLDAAVNSGPGQAVEWLQQALNNAGYGPLSVDGGIGPATIAAATKAVAAMGTGLNRTMIELRRAFLQKLVAERPNEQVFLTGWMNRCNALESEYA